MVFKTVNKSVNLTNVAFILLVVMGIFYGMFYWYGALTTETGGMIDSKYSNITTGLTTSQAQLDTTIGNIKTGLGSVTESDSIYQAAWNSFKGLGAVLKLPLDLVTTVSNTYSSIITPLDVIPKWVDTLTFIGLIAVIVFLIVALLKGEQGKT
jgi:hypothetical protein